MVALRAVVTKQYVLGVAHTLADLACAGRRDAHQGRVNGEVDVGVVAVGVVPYCIVARLLQLANGQLDTCPY
jgi:hypothetical protein